MSHSRTQTITTPSSTTAGPSRSRPLNPPPADPVDDDDEALEEDDDEAIRQAEEKVRRMKARKAAAAARKKAEEEAAKKAAEEAQRKKEAAARELEEPRRVMAEAGVFARRGKGKAKAQPVGGDPDDGDDGDDDDDDEDERTPCERCRSKRIPCLQQAGKWSSTTCKPCHDAKVRCSHSNRPPTVKKEVSSHPTGERLAVLESQVAQLLADNRVLREGQIKSNTYDRHIIKKLEWLMRDAARRRDSPPSMPEPGPSRLPKKRRRVLDSEEEEEDKRVGEEEDGEGEEGIEEEEGLEPAPKKARSEKGKEREE
ncbi:hypothetical protein F5876DRAFT_84931 [Lentinula aff. lateritia]|uniref:Uncharacterized protein n=1 Tax=Lentinula aff. lateritia TaxID=2804960 RepID=A0ACC1TG79_9AGAR|nr:hypothetical protein F5876DRAFT_84931 [Lentinula aff. lateritia]